jgi:hypothetical protein
VSGTYREYKATCRATTPAVPPAPVCSAVADRPKGAKPTPGIPQRLLDRARVTALIFTAAARSVTSPMSPGFRMSTYTRALMRPTFAYSCVFCLGYPTVFLYLDYSTSGSFKKCSAN